LLDAPLADVAVYAPASFGGADELLPPRVLSAREDFPTVRPT